MCVWSILAHTLRQILLFSFLKVSPSLQIRPLQLALKHLQLALRSLWLVLRPL